MSPLELANVIFASEAALVVHDERSASVVLDALALAPSGAVDSCATLHLDEHDLPASGDPVVATDRAPEADPNGLASISFTSGTLGSPKGVRSEEHTSELQALMRTAYAVFCLK